MRRCCFLFVVLLIKVWKGWKSDNISNHNSIFTQQWRLSLRGDQGIGFLEGDFLLAKGAHSFLNDPFLEAVHVEVVLAGEKVQLLAFFHTAVADGAHVFHSLCREGLQEGALFLGQSFGHFPHFFFQFQEFLIGHLVRIDVNSILKPHLKDHIPQIFHIHHTYFFIYLSSSLLLCISSCLSTSFLSLISMILRLMESLFSSSFYFYLSSLSRSAVHLRSYSSRYFNFYKIITHEYTCSRFIFSAWYSSLRF